MTCGTTSAKSVHKFSCRILIYMSTEQEREYTLSVMHVTEFTTQLGVKMSDLAVVYGAQVARSPTHIGAQT